MAATQDAKIIYSDIAPQPITINNFLTIPVESGEIIYEGSLVGMDTAGVFIAGVTSKPFVGIATNHAEGGDTDLILWMGVIVKVSLPGVGPDDIGKIAYVSDSNTATLSSNSAPMGPIVNVETDYAWVNLTGQD